MLIVRQNILIKIAFMRMKGWRWRKGVVRGTTLISR
jgi:hypothetical protein